MLEELTKYSSFGPVESIEMILKAVQTGPCTLSSLISMVHVKGHSGPLHVDASLSLLKELGVCIVDPNGLVTYREHDIERNPFSDGVLFLGLLLFRQSIEEGIIRSDSIEFDERGGSYFIAASSIKMRYSQIRNFLIAAGVLIARGDKLVISSEGASECEHQLRLEVGGMTPEQLMAKLEDDRRAGELAEAFVMDYERKRLGEKTGRLIEQVSLISVSAGFDIASFNEAHAAVFDRLIEVKAYGSRGFFLSSGEVRAARKFGDRYFLYIVDLKQISNSGYEPYIIQNPMIFFMNTTEWRIVPDTYRIKKLSILDSRS